MTQIDKTLYRDILLFLKDRHCSFNHIDKQFNTKDLPKYLKILCDNDFLRETKLEYENFDDKFFYTTTDLVNWDEVESKEFVMKWLFPIPDKSTPRDTPVWTHDGQLLYFSHMDDFGLFVCYRKGRTSITEKGTVSYSEARIANPENYKERPS